MLGPRWDAVIERYSRDLSEEDKRDLWFFTCFMHPAPHSTFHKHIWGSELISNRYFLFFVSDAACPLTSAAEYRPRRFYGWSMGGEWDDALQEYWSMRDYTWKLRRSSARLQRELPDQFPGPDPLLKFYDSKRNGKQPEQKQKLRLIPPPPPTTRPKRRRRPSDPEPLLPKSMSQRRDAPSLPPTAANTSGGKVYTQPLESDALARARALYESVPEDQRYDENDYDSDDEDAEYSDDDEYDEDRRLRLAMLQSKFEQEERERRRDSGGGDANADAGVGPAPKEEKEDKPSSPPPKMNRIAGLPSPVVDSIESPQASSMLPPPSPRPSSLTLPPPSPRPSSAALPQPPPSPQPQLSQLPPLPLFRPLPSPSSTQPAPLALSQVVPTERKKRKFRAIDLDTDPDLDGDSDDEDEDEDGDEDEDEVMEDVDDEG